MDAMRLTSIKRVSKFFFTKKYIYKKTVILVQPLDWEDSNHFFFLEQNRDMKTTRLGTGLLTKADSLVFRSDIAQITDSQTSEKKKRKSAAALLLFYPPKADRALHGDQRNYRSEYVGT